MEKNYWPNRAKVLVGKTIAKVSWMTSADAEENGWYERPVVIEFTDGSWIAPMRDDEGNGGGALCGIDAKTKQGIDLPVMGMEKDLEEGLTAIAEQHIAEHPDQADEVLKVLAKESQ